MEPPPPPQPPQAPQVVTAANTTTTTTTMAPHLAYPESVDSSPRSRNTDSWDEPLPSNATAITKLRLMCSYGGHIVPRPHDKSLCYVGGDTRIVVVDRQTSLADLSSRLSKTLLNNRPFTLKYQLPSEDLDSLISVTTDEDLDNMIDEYDRTSSSTSLKSSRLRLFLFPVKPESSQSIGPILDNSAKSEDWFLNALNAAGLLNRGYSDPASVNCLLGLDEDGVGVNNLDSGGARDVEAGQRGSFGNGKNARQGQDVHSVPDSPMLETTSSFGSTSSSPSLANLPPIRVHVEDGGGGGGVRVQDQKVGIEEQFAQMGVGSGMKQDEAFVVMSSPPPMPLNISMPVSSAVVAGEGPNRVFSDDERSDHGVPVGYRRVQPSGQPQPQSQPQTMPPPSQPKSSGGFDLPSPDSVSSDSSITNPLSRVRPVIYQQEPLAQIPSGTTRMPSNPVDSKVNVSDPNTRVQMQPQVQDSGYVLQSQYDQQQQHLQQAQQQQQQQQQQQHQHQFIHGTHYIHQTPTGPLPPSAYYPVYPPQQQQQHHHHHPNPLDQQYPVYYVPARQPQAYSLSMQQPNVNETATSVPSSRPQTPSPNPAMVSNPAAYNQIRNAPIAKPEMPAGVYRTATTGAPALVQVPSSQYQQQYVGYSQIHHPSQSMAPASAAAANYAYEYADPAHGQIFYAPPMAPTMPSQYQTMTAATGVVLPETSAQHPADNMKQQIRTSQPL